MRNTNIYWIRKFRKAVFSVSNYNITKLIIFTNFKILFLAVVMDIVLFNFIPSFALENVAKNAQYVAS